MASAKYALQIDVPSVRIVAAYCLSQKAQKPFVQNLEHHF
jgi:hypothetical protein